MHWIWLFLILLHTIVLFPMQTIAVHDVGRTVSLSHRLFTKGLRRPRRFRTHLRDHIRSADAEETKEVTKQRHPDVSSGLLAKVGVTAVKDWSTQPHPSALAKVRAIPKLDSQPRLWTRNKFELTMCQHWQFKFGRGWIGDDRDVGWMCS